MIIRQSDVLGFAETCMEQNPNFTEAELRTTLQLALHDRVSLAKALFFGGGKTDMEPVGCILGLVFLPIALPLFAIWNRLTDPAPETINRFIDGAIAQHFAASRAIDSL